MSNQVLASRRDKYRVRKAVGLNDAAAAGHGLMLITDFDAVLEFQVPIRTSHFVH